MENTFEFDLTEKLLSDLPPRKRQIFLYGVCRRLRDGFALFSERTGQRGTSIIDLCLKGAREAITNASRAFDWQGLAADADLVAPDTANFSDPFTSTALDSAVATANLMRSFDDDDTGLITEGVSLIIDSIDMWIQVANNIDSSAPNIEDLIRQHPLMMREIEILHATYNYFQEEDRAAFLLAFIDQNSGWCLRDVE